MRIDPGRLQQLYPPMTEDFARRMDDLLCSLPPEKEETKVKRFALRTVLIWAVLTALLCATAYAVITYGMDWYYNNRFTAYQEHEPEKYAAIMEHMQSGLPQTAEGCDLVDIQVAEASWAGEENVLVVSLKALPADPAVYELHPMWNLDPDGAYMGKDYIPDPSGDSEERADHWLWTEDGFGPVDQMIRPGKQLLLLEADDVQLDGLTLFGDGSSMDSYVGEDGAVHTVLEVQLPLLGEDYEADMRRQMQENPAYAALLEERLEKELACRQLILDDEDGVIQLTVPFRVTPYTDDDQALYQGGETGLVHFDLKIR